MDTRPPWVEDSLESKTIQLKNLAKRNQSKTKSQPRQQSQKLIVTSRFLDAQYFRQIKITVNDFP